MPANSTRLKCLDYNRLPKRIDSPAQSPAVKEYPLTCFSPLTPYMATHPPYGIFKIGIPNMKVLQSWKATYNPNYAMSITRESLSDHMLNLLRRELEDIFYETAAINIRLTDFFKHRWFHMGATPGVMPYFSQPRLPINYFLHQYNHLPEYFNKQLVVYFETSKFDRQIGRYIFREWLRLHHGRPPFQRHNFPAMAVCFTCPQGPPSVQQIVPFHRGFCNRLSERVDDPVDFYARYRLKVKNPDEYSSFGSWPMPSTEFLSWKEHGFALGHLFRSIFMVVDDQVRDGNSRTPFPLEMTPEESNGLTLPALMVLLVRTGDDAHLSDPIDFWPLHEAGQTFEINRSDFRGCAEGWVVRVRLDVALQFIFDLIHREEKALPHIRQAAEKLEEERDEGCKQWVERVLAHAREVGVDSNGFTWHGIRRAQARLHGDIFDNVQSERPWEHLTHWDH